MCPEKWDPEYVLDDRDLWGYDPYFSSEDFLKEVKSPRLSDTPGLPGWIEHYCSLYDINQRFVLVTLQKEQQFITADKLSERAMKYAMGFGATDSGDLGQYAGIKNQIKSACKALGTSYKRACANSVGVEIYIDGRPLRPRTAATAALYRYTPHLNGAKLFHDIWMMWSRQLAYSNTYIVKPVDVLINDGERDEEKIRGLLIRDSDGYDRTYVPLREAIGDLGVEVDWGPVDLSKTRGRVHIYTPDFPKDQSSATPDKPHHQLPLLRKVYYPYVSTDLYDDSSVDDPGKTYYNPWPKLFRGLVKTSALFGSRISQHFLAREFLVYPSRHKLPNNAEVRKNWVTIFDGEKYPEYFRLDPRLVLLLESIRSHFGEPVTIISGYRPYWYNRVIGGVSKSFHQAGMAADIRVANTPVMDVVHYLRHNHPRTGRGIARTWMHVDVRGWSAEWHY